MAIPLKGDRSAWDMNYEHLHASDIENEEFLNHVPTSGSSSEGFILHSSGSGWISSDEIIIPVAIKKVSATPSNPDLGYVKFYAKTNDKFYALDSSGNETEFESSGSSAGVYYFTDLLDVPGSYTDQAGKVIAVNETEDGLEFVVQTSGSSSTTFLALTDTPSSFSGQGLKLLRVNTGANAIEFVDPPTVYDQLTDLTDTPANYTGAGGKILAVKSSADGIEFIDAPTSGSDTTAIHDNESGEINAITEKTTLANNDVFLIEDSADSFSKKKFKASNLPTGGGGGDDPLLYTTPYSIYDHFLYRGSESGKVGMLGWYLKNATAGRDSTAGFNGMTIFTSEANANISARLSLAPYTGTHTAPITTYLIDLIYVRILLPSLLDNCNYRIGLISNYEWDAGVPYRGIYFEALSDDSFWYAVGKKTSDQTRVSTGYSKNNHTLLMKMKRYSSSNWGFKINNNDEVFVTTNIDEAQYDFTFMITPTTGASRSMRIDFFSMKFQAME